MTKSDTHWNDYGPCEIPSEHKKTNYKQMKSSMTKSDTKWDNYLPARFHPVSFVTGQVMALKKKN
jgi:hypothetical protein